LSCAENFHAIGTQQKETEIVRIMVNFGTKEAVVKFRPLVVILVCLILSLLSGCSSPPEEKPRFKPAATVTPKSEAQEERTTTPVVRLEKEEPMVPLHGNVKSYVIRDARQLVPGLLADAALGDLVLENDAVKVVIRRPDPSLPAMPPSGAIIDISNQKSQADYLNYFETIPDVETTDTKIRFERVDAFLVENQTTARLSLSGWLSSASSEEENHTTDSANSASAQKPKVRVTTTYELPKDAPYLLITTTFVNESTSIVSLAPADYIDWGEGVSFTEGFGIGGTGTPVSSTWVGTFVDDFSAGVCLPGNKPLTSVSSGRYTVALALEGLPSEQVVLRAPTPTPLAAEPTYQSSSPIKFTPSLPITSPRPETMYSPTARTLPTMIPPQRGETEYNKALPQPLHPTNTLQTAREKSTSVTAETSHRQFLSASSLVAKKSELFDAELHTESLGGGVNSKDKSETAVSDSSTSSPKKTRIQLKPGEKFVFTRYLIIGDRKLSRVSEQVFKLKGIQTGTIAGVVVEEHTNKPIAGAEIRISGGPSWNEKFAPRAFTKTLTGADGTFLVRLPYGNYYLTAHKVGREMIAAGQKIALFRKSPEQYVGLVLSKESVLQVAVSDPEAATSAPLPARVSVIAKPGTEPIDWGYGPGSSPAVRNVAYMPYGAASLPLTPGNYRVYISRGPEYEAIEQDVVITRGTTQKIVTTLPRAYRPAGMISVDLGVMTTASAVSLLTPTDLVVMAACEGVSVLVTGDFDKATDLSKTISQLQLEKYVKCLPGMRFVVSGRGATANVLVYPVIGETETKLREFRSRTRDYSPDVFLAELRKEFPNLVIEIDQGLHPMFGYLAPIPFDEQFKKYKEEDVPPPDFHAIQVLNGKCVGEFHDILDRYFDLAIKRTRWHEPAPALTPLGSSMARLPYGTEVGYPRVYVLTIHDTLDRFTDQDLAQAIVNQRVIVTNSLFPKLLAYAPATRNYSAQPGDVVDTGTTGALPMKINILAASWVSLSNFDLTWNGKTVRRIQVMPVNRVLRYPVRKQPDADVQYVYVDGDGFANLIAFSNRKSLSPIVPASLPDFGGDVWPIAWTGPIFVDQDRNGKIYIPAESPESGKKNTLPSQTGPH